LISQNPQLKTIIERWHHRGPFLRFCQGVADCNALQQHE